MDEEHKRLEQGAVEQLASVLAQHEPTIQFQFIESLSPPKPDTRCTAEGRDVYVEVTHIYGTKADAKFMLDRKGKDSPTWDEQIGAACIPIHSRLLLPLNELLDSKAKKIYPVSPVWLLIRNALPLWQEDEFRDHLDEIVIPKNHTFQRILLLCGTRKSFGLIDLCDCRNMPTG